MTEIKKDEANTAETRTSGEGVNATEPKHFGFKNIQEVKPSEPVVVKVEEAKIEDLKTDTEGLKHIGVNIMESIKEMSANVEENNSFRSVFLKNLTSFMIIGIILLLIAWNYRSNIKDRFVKDDINTTQNSDDADYDDDKSLPTDIGDMATEPTKSAWELGRPYLGIHYFPIDAEFQKANKLPVDYGDLVKREKDIPAVTAGSPASKAGLMENDIILEIDGVKLDFKVSLASIITEEKKVGDTINLKVLRDGKEQVIKVTLEAVKGSGLGK